MLKVILFSSFLVMSLFSIQSCASKKTYVSKGVDVYGQIELCKNGYFVEFISGNYGTDTIFGKWRKQKDTIYFNYTDRVYYIKEYDSTAKLIEKKIPQEKYGIFKIESGNEDFKQFHIVINNKIEFTTDTIGYFRIGKELNNGIKKIKIYHNLPFYYAEFNNIKQGFNYFLININNPNPDSIYFSNKILHINPRKYIIKKGRKLFNSLPNNKYNGHYEYIFKPKIKLIKCEK